MGGNSSSTNTQNAITQTQLGIEAQQNTLAQQNEATGLQLMQPLISQLTALSSGNPSSVQSALAPYLTNITQNNAQQKGQIMESMGPGVGRDVALANVTQNSGNQIAAEKNSLVQGAATQLASVGQGIESFGLSDVGSAISSASGASSSNQAVMQAQAQSKASTLGFLGSIAGAAGSAPWGSICWIAEAIYGVDDNRTHIIRAYLNGAFREGLAGSTVMWVYARYGRAIAARVERSPMLRRVLKPVFDAALRSALSRQVTVETVLYAN